MLVPDECKVCVLNMEQELSHPGCRGRFIGQNVVSSYIGLNSESQSEIQELFSEGRKRNSLAAAAG